MTAFHGNARYHRERPEHTFAYMDVGTYAVLALATEYHQFRVTSGNNLQQVTTSDVSEIEDALLLHIVGGDDTDALAETLKLLPPEHLEKTHRRYVSFPQAKKKNMYNLLSELSEEFDEYCLDQGQLFRDTMDSYAEAFVRHLRGDAIGHRNLDVFTPPERVFEAMKAEHMGPSMKHEHAFAPVLSQICSLRFQRWPFTIEPEFGYFTENEKRPYKIHY